MGKSKDLASGAAYQDQTESDTRYVNTAGDSMTGELLVRRARSNTAGNAALTIHPSDTTVSYGMRIDQNTNSLNFDQVNSGVTRMSIDSAGRVTEPSQPSFMIRGSSGNKSIASGAAVASGMYNATVLHNVGSHLNTSNAMFTAPVNGRYYLEFLAYTQTTGGLKNEYVAVYLAFSNIGPVYSFHECGPDVCAQISGVFNMSANDTVQPHTYGHGSRTQTYIGQHSYYSGYLIG